ncbi:anti-sigma factor domain-containing protein [Ammoniphilus sp. CFH 90114]|uniref:anti-sigma factor domain-containing protein n=1 Tax=Ammoniphilus sp. CFH 90114 TaxID=2493665 RepID=UPI0013E97112|nr:anti-sigma factor domain-containing protein [Ammoniphilus sp. CFH 90114]
MPLNKGIVMESGEKWTVVLTPDGEFVKIPAHPHHLEGKEVFFHPAAVGIPSSRRRRIPRWMSAVSLATACLLLLVMIFPFGSGSTAYAAVTIDINPSIELEVDEDTFVISATSMNDEGQEILSSFEWKNKLLTIVTVNIVQIAEQKGYMNAENQVLITTTYYQEDNEQDLEPILEQVSESVTTENEITFVLVQGKKEWKEEAQQKNIAPGRFMLVKQAEEQGVELTENEVKNGELDRIPPVSGVKVIPPKPKKDKKDKEKDKDKEKAAPEKGPAVPAGSPKPPGQQGKPEQKKPEPKDEPKSEPKKDQGKPDIKKPDTPKPAEKKEEQKRQEQKKENEKKEEQKKEAPKQVPPKPQDEKNENAKGKENKKSDGDDDRKESDKGKGRDKESPGQSKKDDKD